MGHLLLLLVSVAGDGPSIPSSNVSVSASWLSTGLFELRYADGGCPSFKDALTARNTEQILLILNKYTDLACFVSCFCSSAISCAQRFVHFSTHLTTKRTYVQNSRNKSSLNKQFKKRKRMFVLSAVFVV